MSWYLIAGLGAVVLLSLISRRGERPDRKEFRPPGETASAAGIDALLRAGRKIEAIKEYRELHGVDLKTAKDAVDARARELGR